MQAGGASAMQQDMINKMVAGAVEAMEATVDAVSTIQFTNRGRSHISSAV